ncbi:MAG: Rne/Rng family ribonuclease, partial [Acidobacteria bacterium]|nr:Rne/Rng family ribonuclease [Acidobacteriota bacterium]
MEVQLLVSKDLLFTKIALFESNKLVEFFLEPKHTGGVVGSIFLGKVNKILPGVDCAFIDIGLDRDGFLYEGDMCRFFEAGEQNFKDKKHPLSSLQNGQEILVQVTKEQMGQKGPRLTTAISLPGNYLVYMPQLDRIGASKKISDSERARLKEILTELKGDFSGGFIARTAAEGATREELSSEMQSLAELWSFICIKKETLNAPALIHQELDLPLKVVREILVRTKGELLTDDRELAEKIKASVEGANDNQIKIKLWKNEAGLFETFKVEEELEKALRAKTNLPSGGCIVIQPTEALVAIDVNSGRFIGKKSLEETAFKTNLEAAEEIVRQLRLRNLGGIIVIDFIDMTDKNHREQILHKLQEYLKADKAKTRILKISEFGLVEMTRKRTHKPLDKIYYHSCPCCEGKGKVTAPWRIVNSIVKQLKNTSPHKKYLIRVSSYVKRFLEDNASILSLPQNI